MKNLLIVQRGTTIHRRTAILVAIALFAVLLSATPFNAAFAQTAPNLGAAANFAVLDGGAVTCTDSTIGGDVDAGTVVTQTNCIISGTVFVGDTFNANAYADFLTAYNALADNTNRAPYPCTDTLATAYTTTTVTLTPGVYCSGSYVEFTDTKLILDAEGDPNAVWIFKMGTVLTSGYLTGTNLSVIMANGGQPCNVYWWTAAGATMTDSIFLGTILTGADITVTRGTVVGAILAGGRGTSLAPTGAVTLTNTSVVSCSTIGQPIPPDFCKDYCKDYCKHHGKHKKPCNQGVGNGHEGCDPGNSNHGDDDWSNDEHDGKPGHPGRKGGNDDDDDDDKDHRGRR